MLIILVVLIFGLHVVLANLGIGLSTVIPLMKRKAEKECDEKLLENMHRPTALQESSELPLQYSCSASIPTS